MQKYATATALALALALALITMLTLALSASLTPANAGCCTTLFICNCAGTYPGRHIANNRTIACKWKCQIELWNTANLYDGTRNHPGSCPSSLQACIATCVAAKKVARH
jgi:hypothetical protein